MKKGYEVCPYCANEVKEWSIKCQYCHEFLRDNEKVDEKEIIQWVKQTRIENNAKKWSPRRKWWLTLMLILPVIIVIWILISFVFWFVGRGAYEPWFSGYLSDSSLLGTIRNVINRFLWMFSIIWIIWFIPWLIMFLIPDKDYN